MADDDGIALQARRTLTWDEQQQERPRTSSIGSGFVDEDSESDIQPRKRSSGLTPTPTLQRPPRDARVFARARGMSQQLTMLAASPSKYRVASGRSDFGADGTGFRTEGARLAGWAMVRKDPPKTAKEGAPRVWKRRFIEVDRGELRLFHTDTPENFTLPPREVPMSCTLHMAPTGSSVELRSEDGSTAFHVRASDTVVHDLAQRVLTLRMGDGVQAVGNAINTVVVLPAGREAVLTLLGDVFTTCVKTPKGTLKLEGITIDTSEHQGPAGEECHHRLTVTNKDQKCLVMTVPDPLLLLQWVGAISSSDIAPVSAASDVSRAMTKLVIEEAQKPPPLPERLRSSTLGVGRALGYTAKMPTEDDPIPSKQSIKRAMLDAPSFPRTVLPMREILLDPSMRHWAHQWSRTQYSSENVEFWVACDNLFQKTSVAEKAAGLRVAVERYIEAEGERSINIGGLVRKKLLKQFAEASAKGDAALAELVPNALQEAVHEIERVIEFDIFPSFGLLLEEVLKERSAVDSNPKSSSTSPVTSPREALHVRDILHNQTAMHDLVLFATGQSQDAVIFLTLVVLYRQSEPAIRANMASHVMRTYFEADSTHTLEGIVSLDRVQREWSAVDNPRQPPVELFHAAAEEVMSFVDADLFKRYRKSIGAPAEEPRTSASAPSSQWVPPKRVAGSRIPRFFSKSVGRAAGRAVLTNSAPSPPTPHAEQEPVSPRCYEDVYFIVTSGGGGIDCVEGEPVKVEAPDPRVKQWKYQSLWTGTDGVLRSNRLRPATPSEIGLIESLPALPKFVPRMGQDATVAPGHVHDSSSALLNAEPGDVVVVKALYPRTGWVTAECKRTRLVGLVHSSHLRAGSLAVTKSDSGRVAVSVDESED